MGGGQTGSQQTQTQQVTQLPPWINEAAQQNYGFAQDVAARPLQQYQGQMVADVGPQMQQAWNTAATGANAGTPQFQGATSGFMGALGQTPMNVTAGQLSNTDLAPYMDPYTRDVINSSLPIMQQQLGQTLAQNAGGGVKANAFGGSRFGVQQGTAQAQGALGMANMAAGLNQANFAQAQAAATGDINRTLSAQQGNQTAQQAKINSDIAAASGLNTTGQQLVNQQNQAFVEQNTAGAEQQKQAQDIINANMAKFNQAWNYPTTQMGILQSGLSQTPYGQATSGTSSTQTYTPTDWASIAAGGLSDVAGLAMKFAPTSDKRLKKNLVKVGKHAATGIPIYDFNWKGQPPGAPKTRGPMAQDVHKALPGAVARHPAGHLVVDPVVLGALSRPGAMGPLGAMRGPVARQMTEHRRRVRPPQIRGALGG